MRCDEYRIWVARALRNDLAEGWPLVEFREHFASCHRCQLLLSMDEVAESIGSLATLEPETSEDVALWETVRVEMEHRERLRSHVRGLCTAVLLVAVALLAAHFGVPGEPPGPGAEAVAVVPVPPALETFAKGLESEGFRLVNARETRRKRFVTFVYERTSPDADQYEFAKQVVLSRPDHVFPAAPLFTVSIKDGEENLLQVQVRALDLPFLLSERELDGPRFCRLLTVYNDRDGRAVPRTQED